MCCYYPWHLKLLKTSFLCFKVVFSCHMKIDHHLTLTKGNINIKAE